VPARRSRAEERASWPCVNRLGATAGVPWPIKRHGHPLNGADFSMHNRSLGALNPAVALPQCGWRCGILDRPGRRRPARAASRFSAPMHPSDPGRQPRDDGQVIQLGPQTAEQRLVLLHGWGADADDLLDLAELLVPPEVSVVALRAPQSHPAGSGRQWYPLLWNDMLPEPAWERVPSAREALRNRLLALGATVPLERTALLGFSQGAAMALDVATGGALPAPLAALIACSGYPHRDWQPQACDTPVLLTHGLEDPVVPAAHCDTVQRLLEAAGIAVRRHDFRGGHGIDPALIPAIGQFLSESLQRRP